MTLVVCERFLNVQTSKWSGKNGSWSGAPGGGAPFHGTTGTMVNPALNTAGL